MAPATKTPLIPKGLTEQQWRFVMAYAKCFHATKAAKASGEYKDDKSASVSATRFLAMEPVREAISNLLESQNQLWAQERWRVIQEAMSLAFANIDDFVTWGTRGLKPEDPGYDEEQGGHQDYEFIHFTESKDLPRHVKAAVKSIKKTRDRNGSISIELTLHGKSNNIDKLMKNLGLLNGKSEQKTNRGEFAKWSDSLRNPSDETLKTEALEDEVRQLKAELEKAKGQSDDGARAGDGGADGGGGGPG